MDFDVRVDALEPVLAAEARLLDAGERAAEIDAVLVDRDVPAPDAPGYCLGTLGVRAPDAAREAVVRVVGDRHGVVLVVVGDHADHRTEDLLAGDRHRVVDVGEERRLDEVAARAAGAAAAEDQLRTLGPAGGDVALDARALRLADERADVGLGVRRVADTNAPIASRSASTTSS